MHPIETPDPATPSVGDRARGPAPGAPRRAAGFGFIMVTILLDVMALGLVIPVWPDLIFGLLPAGAHRSDAGWWVGISGTIFALIQFFSQPVIGALSDKVGRRPIILASNLGTGIDWFVMAVAPTLPFLLVGRVISGATSASIGTAFAYVTDITAPERRAGRFGLLGAMFGLGFVLGPALGALVGDSHLGLTIPGIAVTLHGGTRMPFYVAGVLSLLNFAYGWFVLPESLPLDRRDAFRWSRANPVGSLTLLASHVDLLPLAFVAFLIQLAHYSLQTVFTLEAATRFHWHASQIGLAMVLMGVASIVVQGGLAGPAVKLLKERGAITVGLIFGAAGFAIYGFAPTGAVFLIGIPVMSLWGLAGPAINQMMTRRVAPNEQGKLQGANQSLVSIAGILGPAFYGSQFALFIGRWSHLGLPGEPFIASTVLLGLAFLASLRAARDAERRGGSAPAEAVG